MLDLVVDEFAVHQQQPLRDGAAPAAEFVLAAVAVAFDKVVLARQAEDADEDVRSASMVDSDDVWMAPPTTCSGRRRVNGKDGPGLLVGFGEFAVAGAVEPERPRCRR